MFNKKENAIEKITVKYDDGTEKEINKGAVITLKPIDDEETTLNMEFIDFQKEELVSLIYGITEMGVKMGLFNE